jgi:2-phosphoglycerate kinase
MPDDAPRERRIRSRSYPLPFSKGRMAQTLIASGATSEDAYRLAQRIENELAAAPHEEISLEELHDIVEDLLARDSSSLLWRYQGWRTVWRRGRPLIVLLGGATGTGKSSLATELAYRLGVSRITSSDVVRQVMRAFFAPELMPALHESSFEAGDRLRVPMPDPDAEDRALYGFIQQAEGVAVGLNAVLQRALVEGLSMVVEGIHVVPGLIDTAAAGDAAVVQALLAIEDEESHQSHFVARDAETGGARRLDRYLRRFGEIRRIQDYLVARAERTGVPVVDAAEPDRALMAIMDLILERAIVPPGQPVG